MHTEMRMFVCLYYLAFLYKGFMTTVKVALVIRTYVYIQFIHLSMNCSRTFVKQVSDKLHCHNVFAHTKKKKDKHPNSAPPQILYHTNGIACLNA